MKRIDFEKTKPYYINENFKWYFDPYFQNYIQNEQEFNLPKLKNLYCFVVKSETVENYVLIDNNQNVIAEYPYTFAGYEQMKAKLNILKILEHYDNCEKTDL